MNRNAWKMLAVGVGVFLTGDLSAQNVPGLSTPKDKAEYGQIQSSTEQSLQRVDRIRASELLGVNVTSKQGESLGEVQDLVLDPETGRIQFALIGKGFMAGLGERMVPLPWQALNVQSKQDFVVNVDQEKLQGAPAWSQAEVHDADYIIRIYRFYELQPHMEERRSGSQFGEGRDSSSEEPDNSTEPQSSEHDQFKPESAPQPDK